MRAGVVAVLATLAGTATADLEVPFVAQGPLLCGGAAAAMVERYWGGRGVYGEDFRHLVRESEGGIRASELTSAMRDRGYDVEVLTGQPARVFAALDRGVPPILLLESGATRLHYVVLVDVDDRDAWIHDPNFGPRRRVSLGSLARRWAASDGWAMLAVPASGTERSAPGPDAPARAPADTRTEPPPASTATPALAEALERLRNDDPTGARAAAAALVRQGGADALLGRRVLATAWFLDGEPTRALAEWNALGEPVVDLVRIDGLAATRYQVAADRMSLAHGRVLTPRSLGLARRRLEQLPAVEASRTWYRPLPDGAAEVRASVVEPSRVPGFRALAVQGGRGLVHERAALELGPLLAGGDRWRVTGSWAPAQRYLGWSMSAPAPPLPGIATVGMEWRRERFGRAASSPDAPRQVLTEKRSRSFLGIEEWVHPRLRLGAALGLESWKGLDGALDPDAADEPARVGSLELTARWAAEDDRSWLTLGGAGWNGAGRSFGRARIETGADMPQGTRREWRLRAGATAVSAEAPRTLWPGAGTGRVRDPLLRAHGLIEDGVIEGPSLGRELLYGTVEHRIFRGVGPFRAGAALFVDAAHARRRGPGKGSGTFVDVGGGLFVEAGSREGAVSLARGASGWRLSARVGGAP
jgi:hypothetical protein